MEFGALRLGSVFAIVTASLVAGCGPAGVLEADVQPGRPGERDICAVCGAAVATCPAWVAQVVFEDGSSAFFDGTKDLFEYLLSRSRYLPRKHRLEIEAIFVTDYFEQRLIDARTAFFVNGSDVHGPSGRQLVPVETLERAEGFLRDHPGARVIRFENVTPAVLRTLSRPRGKGSTWMAAGVGAAS